MIEQISCLTNFLLLTIQICFRLFSPQPNSFHSPLLTRICIYCAFLLTLLSFESSDDWFMLSLVGCICIYMDGNFEFWWRLSSSMQNFKIGSITVTNLHGNQNSHQISRLSSFSFANDNQRKKNPTKTNHKGIGLAGGYYVGLQQGT